MRSFPGDPEKRSDRANAGGGQRESKQKQKMAGKGSRDRKVLGTEASQALHERDNPD